MNPGLLLARWNLKSLRKPGEESWNKPDHRYLLCQSCCRAVVWGPKTPGGTLTEGTAAAVWLCWSIPHLPIVQKTKGYLSLEALLWYKCQFHNLAGKKKSSPFGFSAVPLLVFATQSCNQKPLQTQDFTRALQCLATDTGGLVKNTLASLPACSVRTASRSRHYIYKYEWKEQTDGRWEWENTLTLKRTIISIDSKWVCVNTHCVTHSVCQLAEEEEEATFLKSSQSKDGMSCIRTLHGSIQDAYSNSWLIKYWLQCLPVSNLTLLHIQPSSLIIWLQYYNTSHCWVPGL